MTASARENMFSTIEAASSDLLLYQDPHELRKRRNRLAQRKHRQYTSQGASAKSRRQNISEQTSAECSSCHNELPSSREIWDTEPGHDAFLTFEADGDRVSAIEFSLPSSTESIKEAYRTSPELGQYVTKMWQPTISAYGPGYLAESGLESGGGFLSQNGTNSAHEGPEKQTTQLHISDAQKVFEPLTSTSNTNHPLQSIHGTAFANNAPTDHIVLRGSISQAAEDNRNNFQSTDAEDIFATKNSVKLSALLATPYLNLQGEDLETRFESVIRAIEKAGFESIDDMSTQYYTASFKEDSLPYWTQARSRRRLLPAFLASLHKSTNDWTDRDARGYRQEIMHAAESVHLNELASAIEKFAQDKVRWKSTEENATSSFGTLWKTIMDLDKSPEIKRRKTSICKNMPETWSLLLELTQKVDLYQPRGSQLVGGFLLLLLDHRKGEP